MKKQLIPRQLFRSRPSPAGDRIEEKVNAIVQQLAATGATGEEIDEVASYINQRLETLEPYRKFLASHPLEAAENSLYGHELEILIPKGHGRRRKKEIRFPNPIRLIISILMITLGFAMIILPAPPYFEMYTIFYFTENDGFTLMDLISLIIVFCGIFTLIMTMQKRRNE